MPEYGLYVFDTPHIVEHPPCLESVLLSILNDSKAVSGKNSDWCKREFELKYLEKKKRSEPKEYEKLLPKSLLDKRRKKIAELDKLISVMQGK